MTLQIDKLSVPLQTADWAAAARCFAGMPPLVLAQAWRRQPETGLQRGQVQLGWEPAALWVYARLDDSDIFNSASEHNTLSHETGDVFELFLSAAPKRYIELHVTPDNMRLQLQWPDPDAVNEVRAGKQDISRYIAADGLFDSSARTGNGHWQVLARIPAASLCADAPLQADMSLRAAFCRYDSFRDGRATVCSSTAPLQAFDFHRRQEWPLFTLR